MRLVIDENLSLDVAAALRGAGHNVVHVLDAGLQSAPDEVIMAWAATETRIVVTADTDFGTLLAQSGDDSPSVVTLRSSDHLTPEQQASLVGAALTATGDDLLAGSVASVTVDRVRVRRLPIISYEPP